MREISDRRHPEKLPDNIDCLHDLLGRRELSIHMIGVCGVGMAGLAFHLRQAGFRVTGCDIVSNDLAVWLEKIGVHVENHHDRTHVQGCDLVVRSSAVSMNNPEIGAAVSAGIPVYQRGIVLAVLASRFKLIAISGTHGKTTAASMTVQVLQRCGLDPCFCIGGESMGIAGVAGHGNSGIMVVEADESDGTLVSYMPGIAVITNIEFDHAEYFRNLREMRNCFAKLIEHTTKRIIYCHDDRLAEELCRNLPNSLSYGMSPSADLRATELAEDCWSVSFAVILHGKKMGVINLPVPGKHNVLNALAAIAVAVELSVDVAEIKGAIERFVPVMRRFERVADRDGVTVISDYAHHPSEIITVIRNARLLKKKRVLAVFQPHRFSRTKALGNAFFSVFEGVDELILTPVYAASEQKVLGGTIWDLYVGFRQENKVSTICASSLDQTWNYLRRHLKPKDALLIIGAGNIDLIARRAGDELSSEGVRNLNPVRSLECGLQNLKLESTIIRKSVPLARSTTLHVGGKADIFLNVGKKSDLVRVIQWADENAVPVFVLGAGSNVLISDLGVHGVVLRLDGEEFRDIRVEGENRVAAGTGVMLNGLLAWLASHGYSGLEFLTDIPGTLGGALRMNAGTCGESIGDRVEWVRCLDSSGYDQVIKGKDLMFGYRKCEGLHKRIAVEALLKVEQSSNAAVRAMMGENRKKRAWMRGLRSAGSIFRNPDGDFAGRLIDQAGMKGCNVGGARVYEKHANIFITEKGANASDVYALIALVRDKVASNSGISLEEEIVYFE